MKLLVEATYNSTTHYISNEFFPLTYSWLGWVSRFDQVNRKMQTRHGGMARTEFGNLELFLDLFDNGTDWEPPNTMGLAISYTESDYASRVQLFVGTGYFQSMSESTATYGLYEETQDLYILDDVWPYEDTALNIRDATYKWTLSGSGTNEYYMELTAGGDPGIDEPLRVNDSEAFSGGSWNYYSIGIMGSLSVSEWDWGDNDTLGFSTIYVRRYDNTDPDSASVGSLYAEYGENSIPEKRAIGSIRQRELTRLSDRILFTTLYQCYRNAGISTTTVATWIFSIANNGSGICRASTSTHGFVTGNNITIEIEPNHSYNGNYTITVINPNTFDFGATYVSTETGNAFLVGSDATRAYDSGIPTRMFINADNVIYVAGTSGTVTFSGTAGSSFDSLTDVFTWACGASYLNKSLTTTYASNFVVDFLVEKQQTLLQFLSNLSAGYCNYFTMTATTLELAFVLLSRGSKAYTEYDILENVIYSKDSSPLASLTSQTTNYDWDELQGNFTVTATKYDISGTGTLYAFGNDESIEIMSDNKDVVIDRINRIIFIRARGLVQFTVPMEEKTEIGYYVTFTDTLPIRNISVSGQIIQEQFDFDRELVTYLASISIF